MDPKKKQALAPTPNIESQHNKKINHHIEVPSMSGGSRDLWSIRKQMFETEANNKTNDVKVMRARILQT